MSDHEHRFGDFERSRLAGTLVRRCADPGCRVVSLDGDEDDDEDGGEEECPHGFPVDDIPCRACVLDEFPTQRDFDHRFDPRI